MLTVSLQMENRICVCIGGGAVAERRIGYLVREKAKITVVSPEVTPKIKEWAKQGVLDWKMCSYDKKVLIDAQYVFVMTDNKALNSQCVADAKVVGALVNRADKQSDCDFTLPAELCLGDLKVTVSTGKCSPRLNRLVRNDMAKRYGPIQESVVGIKNFREEVKNLLPTSKEREEFWQINLTDQDLQLILKGDWSEVEEKIKHAISSARR